MNQDPLFTFIIIFGSALLAGFIGYALTMLFIALLVA